MDKQHKQPLNIELPFVKAYVKAVLFSEVPKMYIYTSNNK